MSYLINVLIITYNQQSILPRAIESILSQKDYGLNKIVIQDDCSSDGTWNVIQDYIAIEPDMIIANQNARNLGIYANANALLCNSGSADFYIFLAGDDELKPGLFQALQKYSSKENLNCEEEIGVFFDWESVRPDGLSYIFSQSLVSKGYSPYSLFIRHRIYQRGMFISRKIMDSYEPTILSEGLNLAEFIFSSQAIRKVQKSYYIPVVGSIYYNGIGVSTQLADTRYYKEDEIVKLKYFLTNFTSSFRDKMWIIACIHRTEYHINPRFSKFILMFVYFILGLAKYDCNLRSVKSFFYPVVYHLRKKYGKIF